jgi:S-adenosylmethionine:tRNA-ribosyltransferase-isomerase (queuine synthetase)
MKTEEFNYFLPQELIAQTPSEPRDSSRLLVYDRKTGSVTHGVFRDIINYIKQRRRACNKQYKSAAGAPYRENSQWRHG